MEKVRISLGDKDIVLQYEDLDINIDVDNYLKVDYGNLMGDIITFPVFFSQLAHLRGEAETNASIKKMELDIYEAKQRGYYRKKLFADNQKKPSIQEVEDAVMIDPGYSQKRKKQINADRDFHYLDALYWSAKSKDGKLNKIIDKLGDRDILDVVEGVFNGISINAARSFIGKRD